MQKESTPMQDLVQLFDTLEAKGWVCLLKWDGQRTKRQKTVVVTKPEEDQLFRGDFPHFGAALEALWVWLEEQQIIL